MTGNLFMLENLRYYQRRFIFEIKKSRLYRQQFPLFYEAAKFYFLSSFSAVRLKRLFQNLLINNFASFVRYCLQSENDSLY
jgi:hypothetical protein